MLTPHFRNALHYSALRTGLTFVPTALAHGAVGWRRLPQRLHPVLVPDGFVLLCAALLRVGPALKDGGYGGAWAFLAYTGVGAGFGFAHSAAPAAASASVRKEHAADASGLVVPLLQVGLLLRASLFGTLFLNRPVVEGAGGASRALWVSVLAPAGAEAFGWAVGVAGRRT